MNPTFVFMIAMFSRHGQVIAIGPEFSTLSSRERAVQAVIRSAEEGQFVRQKPICVRIEK